MEMWDGGLPMYASGESGGRSLKVGDKIKIHSPDFVSTCRGVKIGHIGKVTHVYSTDCFAENPLWGKKPIGLSSEEFTVIYNKTSGDLI